MKVLKRRRLGSWVRNDGARAMNYSSEDLRKFRAAFKTRKALRTGMFFGALLLMLAITTLVFPSWELFGMPKRVWSPFFYLVMFADIIAISVIWRCPACQASLGEVFRTRYCSSCGITFDETEKRTANVSVESPTDNGGAHPNTVR